MNAPRGTLRATGLVALLLAPPVAQACGYEDPNSATFQRGVLNWSYPNALYVQGAVTQAILDRTIEPPAATRKKDLFGSGFRSAANRLNQFGSELQPGDTDEFPFTLVLIEPMLWSRYAVGEGTVGVSTHVKGPQRGDLVVVTAEAALEEIVSHRLSWERAEELGLVRFYGDPVQAARLRALAATPAARQQLPAQPRTTRAD